MFKISILFILGLSFGSLSLGTQDFCALPVGHWCDTVETAARCKVLDQCREFVWSRNSLQTGEQAVNFTLYMESLCPDCKNFFKTQLWPVWSQIGHIMNLVLVPYGNAHEEQVQGKWKFTCQHGVQECIGNIIETCAIHLYTEQEVHVPFINCIEETNTPRDVNISDVAMKCAMMHKLDFEKIEKCAWSPWGDFLEHKMAEKTNSLQPPHKYVPWVTLNGVHTDEIQKEAQTDLLKLICDAYQGEKPHACGGKDLPKHSLK